MKTRTRAETVELLAEFMKIDMKTNADAIEEAYKFMRIGREKSRIPASTACAFISK